MARTLRPSLLLLALALALVPLTGCRSLARRAFKPPVVEVQDVRVRGIGLTGGTLDVSLSVQNPNGYRIEAKRVTYEFYLDTTRIVAGDIDQRVVLEQRGATQFTIPVTIGYAALGVAMREYLSKGALDYRVSGQFTLVTPIGSFTRPYAGFGRVEGMP
jgi:LEA14-like dessication related protein